MKEGNQAVKHKRKAWTKMVDGSENTNRLVFPYVLLQIEKLQLHDLDLHLHLHLYIVMALPAYPVEHIKQHVADKY